MKLLFMDLDDEDKIKPISLNGLPPTKSDEWRNAISQTGNCYIIASDNTLNGV